MTLTLVPIDHGELCHGWAWTVDDEDVLAERVARIVLWRYEDYSALRPRLLARLLPPALAVAVPDPPPARGCLKPQPAA